MPKDVESTTHSATMPATDPPNGSPSLAADRHRAIVLPDSPQAAASVGLPGGEVGNSMAEATATHSFANGAPVASGSQINGNLQEVDPMRLELEDGTAYQGFGFGAKKSVAGELVFQTGMVGYPESITDPSYRGQILVVTFPLVGNYGVPSRETLDEVLRDLPAHFESTKIHVSGLVVASYSGEDYSHHLATSSLGTWLKEQDIPAIYGIDTRALTKRIRQEGSMLGKILKEKKQIRGIMNGHTGDELPASEGDYEKIDWTNPNRRNLVADGETNLPIEPQLGRALTFIASLCAGASPLLSACKDCLTTSVRPSYQSAVH